MTFGTELIKSSLHVHGIPQHQHVDDQAKRAELIFSHSIGFSGRQMASDGEGSSTLDFPLIHDVRSQDQP